MDVEVNLSPLISFKLLRISDAGYWGATIPGLKNE
jgi:hypothetical protein